VIQREAGIFLIVGSLTVLVDFVAYRVLAGYLDLDVNLAKGVSFITGTVFAYIVNRVWTFGHKTPAEGSIWRFALLYAATLAINVSLNALLLTMLLGITFVMQLAFIVATGVSAALNFVGMKWFVFRESAT
jgi:putative flippase GtrA